MVKRELVIVGACIVVMAGVAAYTGQEYHRLMDPIFEEQHQYLLQYDGGGAPGLSLDERVNAIYAENPSTTMVKRYNDIHDHNDDTPLGEFYGRIYKTLLICIGLVALSFTGIVADVALARKNKPKVEPIKTKQ